MTDRRPFLAGNWKMHLTVREAVELAVATRDAADAEPGRDVAVFPPLTALAAVIEATAGSSLRVGGQNTHHETHGAFTGEVSAEQLADAGATMVLVGHSERRHVFGESHEVVALKLRAALRAGLEPILCVGETIEERQAERTEEVVRAQTESALDGVSDTEFARITLAYEPVWAIGTGLTASPDQAQEVHHYLRGVIAGLYGEGPAEAVRIQYGGSVKPANIAGLMLESDIDGALVGGASLEGESFTGIVRYRGS